MTFQRENVRRAVVYNNLDCPSLGVRGFSGD
jgi:hypothetical protein